MKESDIEKDKLVGKLHKSSVLVMLPFDAKKLHNRQDLNIKVNEEALKGTPTENIKVGDKLSFIGHDKEKRVEYELLAFASHDRGYDIACYKNTKSNEVFITYPGYNNPIKDIGFVMQDAMPFMHNSAARDDMQEFVKTFNDELVPILEEKKIKGEDITCISHSSGDGEHMVGALDLANRYNIKVEDNIFIDPWRNRTAMIAALFRSAENELCETKMPLEQKEVNKKVRQDYDFFNNNSVTMVSRKPSPISALINNVSMYGTTVEVDTVHTAQGYMFMAKEQIADITGKVDTNRVEKTLRQAANEVTRRAHKGQSGDTLTPQLG